MKLSMRMHHNEMYTLQSIHLLQYCEQDPKQESCANFSASSPMAQYSILNIKILYPNMAGVDIWEYYKAPPCKDDQSVWSKKMKEVLTIYTPKSKFSIGCLLN